MSEYNTGTVSVNSGSQVVTGSGTEWNSYVSAGDLFTILDSGVIYQVASVDSDTQVTLSGAYAGATASGLSYAIVTSFTSPDSIPYPEPGDTQPTAILKRAMAKVQELFTARDFHAATSKATPVDDDELPLADSAASFALKKLTWANLKNQFKTDNPLLEDIADSSPSAGNIFQFDGTNVIAVQHINRENFIIGGDLATNGTNPYQRGTSGTASTGTYMSDRWSTRNSIAFTTQPTWAQTADGLTITSNEATTHSGYAENQYRMEGYEVTRLFSLADYFVLHGKITCSLTGTVYVSVRSSGLDYSYVFPVSVSAGVTADFSEIIPAPTSGTFGTGSSLGMVVDTIRSNNDATLQTTTFNAWQAGSYISGSDQLDLHATNGATISIDKIKVEPGQIQTPFWTPDYGEELRRCQRYYETGQFRWQGHVSTSANVGGNAAFKVTKRTGSSVITASRVSESGTGFTTTTDVVNITEDGFFCRRLGDGVTNGAAFFINDWISDDEL